MRSRAGAGLSEMRCDSVKEFARTERVGAELRRELAQVLCEEVKDPRLGLITVQEVRVSRDLAHAKVYFTGFSVDEGGAGQERLLNGALAGFLRRALSHRMRLRTMPELHFVHDTSVAQGEHLSSLIEAAVAARDPDSEQG